MLFPRLSLGKVAPAEQQ